MNSTWYGSGRQSAGDRPPLGAGGANPAETRVKLLLAGHIRSVAERSSLSHADIAIRTGLAPEIVSRIAGEQLANISVWQLMRMLDDLGVAIDITLHLPDGRRVIEMG
ncbi:hypothetical protein SAE02_77560 [Skermanella aerolata]|uniref:HigA2-like helix-turn-helix domain-containing protein n=1 Tax=Skermanella aerolata TaxID=393310 RepID=A0A512E4H0_9PROT|nr:XRE family transcriptional regulator [Skermanella aerolata]KJB89991.1 hypothetical protein N826_08745 [Skermanella aerolata KACC 11604]GEO43608.1 hypothetical protein SAE02_77560 [Skermanella aerolata]